MCRSVPERLSSQLYVFQEKYEFSQVWTSQITGFVQVCPSLETWTNLDKSTNCAKHSGVNFIIFGSRQLQVMLANFHKQLCGGNDFRVVFHRDSGPYVQVCPSLVFWCILGAYLDKLGQACTRRARETTKIKKMLSGVEIPGKYSP